RMREFIRTTQVTRINVAQRRRDYVQKPFELLSNLGDRRRVAHTVRERFKRPAYVVVTSSDSDRSILQSRDANHGMVWAGSIPNQVKQSTARYGFGRGRPRVSKIPPNVIQLVTCLGAPFLDSYELQVRLDHL